MRSREQGKVFGLFVSDVLLLQECLGLYFFCAGLIDYVLIFRVANCLDPIWKAVEKMLLS